MRDLFTLYDFVHLFADHQPREVSFRYDLERDDRLVEKASRTEWERYYKQRLFGGALQSEIDEGSRLAVHEVALTGDFTRWRERLPMRLENGVYATVVSLRPGLYHYKFALRCVPEDGRWVELDDPRANADLCLPDLQQPGLKKSGVLVYPRFVASAEGRDIELAHVRGRFDALSARAATLKLAVPSAHVARAFVAHGADRYVLTLLDEIDGFAYLHAHLPMAAAREGTVELAGRDRADCSLRIDADGRARDRAALTESFVGGDLTPGWTKSAVWYTILPDRFRHASSDPVAEAACNERWRKDWHGLLPGETSYYPDIYFRKYHGNIEGLRRKISYLEALGVNSICLTPVFYAGSYHKYDTIDLRHIDPDFGPDPEGDRRLIREAGEGLDPSTWVMTRADRQFIELMKELHERGFRVVIDGVFSHVGDQFWAFTDVKRRGSQSPYLPWFWVTDVVQGAEGQGIERLEYEGFFGMRQLPKLRWTPDGLQSEVERHLFDITKRWMAPLGPGALEYGVDGWRLDVANELPVRFWEKWRAHVKALNPQAFILGEMLGTAFERFLDGSTLDAVINYRFGALAVAFLVNDGTRISAADAAQALRRLKGTFRDACTYAMQNALDSHDLDRVVSGVRNRNRPYGTRNKIQYAHHGYDGGKPNQIDYQILRSLVAFQVMCIGAPHLLYGTEAGMWGSTDPHCRKPMVWDDLGPYEPECCGYPADQSHRLSVDDVAYDAALARDLSALLWIRRRYGELNDGDLIPMLAEGGGGLGIVRRSGAEVCFAVFNEDVAPRTLTFGTGAFAEHRLDAHTLRVLEPSDVRWFTSADGTLTIHLGRKCFAIFSNH